MKQVMNYNKNKGLLYDQENRPHDLSFDSYTSKDGKHLLNIVYDTKSVRSLLYHLYGSDYLNHSRTSCIKPLSTTYQFYIWKSRK